MSFQSKISLSVGVLALATISGCAHGLPQRDLNPSQAEKSGYFVTADAARARGGVDSYVSKVCSKGGWGMPDPACEPAQPVAAAQVIQVSQAAPQVKSGPNFQGRRATKVFFDSNSSVLSRKQEGLVLLWLKELGVSADTAASDSYKIGVRAFADSRRSTIGNERLSQMRAATLAKFLNSQGFRVQEFSGLGAIPKSAKPGPAQEARRAEVVIESATN